MNKTRKKLIKKDYCSKGIWKSPDKPELSGTVPLKCLSVSCQIEWDKIFHWKLSFCPGNNRNYFQFVTSKLNSKTIPVLPSLSPFLIFPFYLLPSPVHPTRFSLCFFPDFLVIFIFSSNKNNIDFHKPVILLETKWRLCAKTPHLPYKLAILLSIKWRLQ